MILSIYKLWVEASTQALVLWHFLPEGLEPDLSPFASELKDVDSTSSSVRYSS